MKNKLVLSIVIVMFVLVANVYADSESGQTYKIFDNATGGDCTLIGVWDASSKTCTLTGDVQGSIQMDASNVTLDGAGYTINGGANAYHCVYIAGSSKTGVVVRNTVLTGCNRGIDFYYRTFNNLIENNRIEGNVVGIVFYYGNHDNTIANNVIINNGAGIQAHTWNHHQTIRDNIISSNSGAFGIWIIGGQNTPDCYSCLGGNTISGNTITGNGGNGVWLTYVNENTITGNTIAGNEVGITVHGGADNVIADNIIEENAKWGFMLITSSAPYISKNNLATGNIIKNNAVGIRVSRKSVDNLIYNNLFDNMNNYESDYPICTSIPCEANAWNIEKTPGTNIVGGPFLGGNFWGNPEHTGYSDTCADNDGDRICDEPLPLLTNNIDQLPLEGRSYSACGIEDLLASLSIDEPGNSLYAKARNICSAYENGNTTTAINMLGAFINEAEVQKGKKLSDSQVDACIDYAEGVIALIE